MGTQGTVEGRIWGHYSLAKHSEHLVSTLLLELAGNTLINPLGAQGHRDGEKVEKLFLLL